MSALLAKLRSFKLLAFAACLMPFALMVLGIVRQSLGPDPAESLMQSTGEWAFRILALVLLARPLSKQGWPQLFRVRRMLGLFMFFYVCVHLLLFAQVYVGWSAEILAEELVERPYVIVGFAAWLLLLPLAVTSTDGWRRRLRQHWRQLHRAVYAVTLLAWLHVLWLARSDIGDAVVYGVIFGVLLGWRAKEFFKKSLRTVKP